MVLYAYFSLKGNATAISVIFEQPKEYSWLDGRQKWIWKYWQNTFR